MRLSGPHFDEHLSAVQQLHPAFYAVSPLGTDLQSARHDSLLTLGCLLMRSHLTCEAEHVALDGLLDAAAAAAAAPQPVAMTADGFAVERSPDAADREAAPRPSTPAQDAYAVPQQRVHQA